MQKRIKIGDLKSFCSGALIKEGFSKEQADISAEVLSVTDAFGVHSHATKNLHNYIRKTRLGGIERDLKPEIIKEGHNFALIDGNAVMGMVSAYQSMKIAVEKAKNNAIACVSLRNASHFGAAGYYALMAAEEGMIGLSLTCGDRNTTVPGGKGPITGNNPLAYAIPTGKYKPIFMDIAFSNVAALKIVKAKQEGAKIPDTWLADENGIPTTDPSGFPDKAALLPVGAHKGYGLSLMVDILTSVLSGGSMVMDIHSWLYYLEEKNNVSQMFIVINVEQFMETDKFRQRVDTYIEYLHNAPKAQGSSRIYYPGEIEWDKYREAEKNGLLLPDDVSESLQGLSEETGVSLKWIED